MMDINEVDVDDVDDACDVAEAGLDDVICVDYEHDVDEVAVDDVDDACDVGDVDDGHQ